MGYGREFENILKKLAQYSTFTHASSKRMYTKTNKCYKDDDN